MEKLHRLTVDQTNDIAMTIDGVLNDKPEVIKQLIGDDKENLKLVRDLLMNAYVRGFFSGMRHEQLDAEEIKKLEGPSKYRSQ